jgi:hypothetical protein
MRKYALLMLAMGTFSMTSLAQSGNDAGLVAQAKQAARDAGCFANYNGPIDATVNETPCVEGGTETEVVFYTKCTGGDCTNVLPQVLARVSYGCPFYNIGAPFVTCGE